MAERSYNNLIERIKAFSESPVIEVETLGIAPVAGNDYPIFLVHLGKPSPEKLGVTISAGIHGDEPAGVEAALQFIEKSAKNEELLSRFYFIVFPCDNPSGWEMNTRENAEGIDLNRQFAARRPAPEAAIISKGLAGRCFDLVFEMHEDIDAHGFYLYELAENPEDKVGEAIIQAVQSSGVPIPNLAPEIEGLPAKGGIIRPPSVRRFRKTRLPKAVYTYRVCGGHVITLEPPASVLPLEARVRAELISLAVALGSAAQRRWQESPVF